MNEVALHRGSSPHLNTVDAFVDGQHLTEAVVSILQKAFLIISDPVMLLLVGRFNCLHANRFYSLFALCWRPDRSSFAERSRSYTNLPSKSFLPPTGFPSLFLHNSPSEYCTDRCL